MDKTKHELIAELRTLIGSLGEQGGVISPSIYDTAQALRLYPPTEGVDRTLAWLLDCQQPDGGWGQATVPAERTVPTLAALLALKTYRSAEAAEQIAAGVAFLESQSALWQDLHIDLVPIAAEMIVPCLLDEAEQLGLVIDRKPYTLLYDMRRRKLERVAALPLQANTAPTYSWEALGLPFSVDVLDPHTGVGHSPAATVAWLKQARHYQVDEALCAQAEAYLARAHAATQSDIPGLYPVVYPISGFELTYGLYALLLTDLLDHPALRPAVQAKMQELEAVMIQENGINFGEGFEPDVDVSSVGAAVLRAAGYESRAQWVLRFARDDHFYTFVYELNPSVFSNAHAIHALTWLDVDCEETEKFLLERQGRTGRWIPDKWHSSWRATMMEAVVALGPLGHPDALRRAAEALCADQLPDGYWDNAGQDAVLETVYSVLTLLLIHKYASLTPAQRQALAQAQRWLLANYNGTQPLGKLWVGKELYSPVRVDEMYALSTLVHAITTATVQPDRRDTPDDDMHAVAYSANQKHDADRESGFLQESPTTGL